MKKLTLTLLAVLLTLATITMPIVADEDLDVNTDVELTKEQQAELEELYGQMFDTHNQIIDKYVEFGVYSEKKAEKLKERMTEKHSKLKDFGYIPKWFDDKDKKDKKHKR